MNPDNKEAKLIDMAPLDFEREELQGAFHAAFDDEAPSADLMARTLAAMQEAYDARQGTAEKTTSPAAAPSNVVAFSGAQAPLSMRDSVAVKRSKGASRKPRMIWRYAIAACLTMALGAGGLAYALPMDSIIVTMGPDSASEAAITLKTNCFGRVVRYEVADDLGDELGSVGVIGMSYQDAMETLLQAVPDDLVEPLEVSVISGNGTCNATMEGDCQMLMEQHRARLGLGSGEGQGMGQGQGQGEGQGQGQGQDEGQDQGNGGGQGYGQGKGQGRGRVSD